MLKRFEPALNSGIPGILPSQFDTPMFWDEKDLAELQGTSVVGKQSIFCHDLAAS